MVCRYQHSTLQLLPAGATVAGWVIFLPLDQRALFTAHEIFGLASLEISRARALLKSQGSRRGHESSRSIALKDQVTEIIRIPVRLRGEGSRSAIYTIRSIHNS